MAILIYGRNSIIEAINCRRVNKIYLSSNFTDKRILDLIKEFNIQHVSLNNNELNNMVKNTHHQGVVAEVKEYTTYPINELIKLGKNKKNPVIVMLDGIEDPHNLGATLRIVDAFDALGVIVKKNSQAPLNATVDKVSTGAINYVKVSEVSNLSNAINLLKKEGYWIVSTDGDGKDSYTSIDYNSPIVLVIGSEGKGISRLVKENSDFIVKIPMYGHVNSLNASNALSVVLSHIVFSKNKK